MRRDFARYVKKSRLLILKAKEEEERATICSSMKNDIDSLCSFVPAKRLNSGFLYDALGNAGEPKGEEESVAVEVANGQGFESEFGCEAKAKSGTETGEEL